MRRLLLAVIVALVPLGASATNKVKLTLVLVPEKDACAGGSYLQDGSCSGVEYDDAIQWAEQRPHLTVTLEPGSHAVELPTEFFEKFRLLVDYDNFPPPDTDGRWSMVLMFEVPTAAGKTATLRRKATDGISGAVTQMVIGDLGHALTHQRADAFKPVRSVSWLLIVGSDNYRFWMKKP